MPRAREIRSVFVASSFSAGTFAGLVAVLISTFFAVLRGGETVSKSLVENLERASRRGGGVALSPRQSLARLAPFRRQAGCVLSVNNRLPR